MILYIALYVLIGLYIGLTGSRLSHSPGGRYYLERYDWTDTVTILLMIVFWPVVLGCACIHNLLKRASGL